MKTLILLCSLGWIALPAAVAQSNPLERRVDSSHSFKKFDDIPHSIGERTGFQVRIQDEFSAFLRDQHMSQSWGTPGVRQGSVREFLSGICNGGRLGWSYDATTNVVTLDLPWRIADPRPRQQLLGELRQKPLEDASWMKILDELLSTPENFARAWRVRQAAMYEGIILPRFEPLLVQPVNSALQKKSILVLVRQPIAMHPGRGSLSYYWFEEDGTLLGAGLMNTGHRCTLLEASLDPEIGFQAGRISTLHLKLVQNLKHAMTATLFLGKDRLELMEHKDAKGERISGYSVGEALVTSQGWGNR